LVTDIIIDLILYKNNKNILTN